MKDVIRAVVVVDPIGSAFKYGCEIRSMGYQAVALITKNRYSEGLNKFHNVSGYEVVLFSSTLEEAVAVLSDFQVRAVIPGSDVGITMSDNLAEYLSLLGNSTETSLARFDKLEMKLRLGQFGVRSTPAHSLSIDGLIKGHELNLPYPVVVKPTQGTGSRNVRVCCSRSDVYKALAAIETVESALPEPDRQVLVEEYIPGTEYFVVTANLGRPNFKRMLCFAEYEKIQVGDNPSVYRNIRSIATDSEKAREVFSYVCDINSAIGADFGINDVELKINTAGVFVIEQNGRLPGANVPVLIEKCTGLNCYRLNVDIFLSKACLELSPPCYSRHFCVCCLITEEAGVMGEVEGIGLVESLESFDALQLMVSAGEHVRATQDFLSAWAFVYLIHEDPWVLRKDSERVHASLRMRLA
ncbi:ATP-grasp domain-containing protein [Pseudomonas sp. BP8]|uniref:ATP-grasp domain-containing protein n=1 Tax=Pseudomonas sp. BP8 TaxID=2817864 RepID=UPI001AE971AF|nr:ATP-grasp domain-containing protein [Pseudomonas sp. BP8]MBP2261656.1 biotin carboxylase [Pseudomonas sp. BP8]HDS1737943.1 ATP-grasp domain-containing protein [Pseudomonas putida]